MTETGIIALVGIIATLGGTLLATVLANQHASRQARAERTFALQDSVRPLIVTAIVEGRAWHSAVQSVGMVSATANSMAEVDNYLKKDLVDSWTGEQMRDHGQALKRAVTELRILIADSPLRNALLALENLHSSWWKMVIEPVRDLHKQGSEDKVARLHPVSTFEAAFMALLSDVETQAAVVVSDDLSRRN